MVLSYYLVVPSNYPSWFIESFRQDRAVSNDQRADLGRSLAKPSKGRVPSCSRKLLDVNAARSGKLDRVDGLCDRADGASLIHTARVDALVARERLRCVVDA